eukprot:CAMPEP_0171721062 /NCGR_PEP_ID=MMETSP0991-20121206/22154_1 /TAXON_ID=483369 /ORGANISM="non described non described, Strain CCMP2098" /LENGTH=165 /DNA_ID=CAMNT_0012312897 /DNA_START=224 /DNA_END=721 /DNA_ORIENTATION=+
MCPDESHSAKWALTAPSTSVVASAGATAATPEAPAAAPVDPGSLERVVLGAETPVAPPSPPAAATFASRSFCCCWAAAKITAFCAFLAACNRAERANAYSRGKGKGQRGARALRLQQWAGGSGVGTTRVVKRWGGSMTEEDEENDDGSGEDGGDDEEGADSAGIS